MCVTSYSITITGRLRGPLLLCLLLSPHFGLLAQPILLIQAEYAQTKLVSTGQNSRSSSRRAVEGPKEGKGQSCTWWLRRERERQRSVSHVSGHQLNQPVGFGTSWFGFSVCFSPVQVPRVIL